MNQPVHNPYDPSDLSIGFYSLFSITESPFVTSGDEWMGFYWKDGKDQVAKLPRSS
jgi:hypothetical protein